MQLVLATENKDKATEIRSIAGLVQGLKIQTLSDYPHLRLPPETGASYRENALAKARYVSEATGSWALGDDSGLEVEALEGAPGLFSARFAGLHAGYGDNRAKLLRALEGLTLEQRGARFVCTLALVSPEGAFTLKEGLCEGRIALSESGQAGFGYDPVFLVPHLGKTFAEIPTALKHQLSHRGRALQALLPTLRSCSA